ncbi:phenylalanyl-tRNA synthetase beta subunit [Mycoplasma testudineum]|uniref:Phenylalanine--tRNA ligase beta subunit n=1 Tax=Mycoplasma testudineum TaxID=244584 RepID=A0A4R6IH18_9MOLU|nr:phenylalanine--tRNA ligase subunit beta [Mycoplasma testudineum]OYD27125.1 phenylalanine--tRNA ligase subunit beta [Mycoplasma testudineum]TDO21121.1 phenylalanyl-tRNA synthetase beta subunit [Mycoplasma testudineum]
MLFSYKKLKQIALLDESIKIEDVVNAINSIGFEVEEYKSYQQIHGIKFGKVLNVYKNKNSDKLNVCEILFEDKRRIIQTAAQNVLANKTVMAFIPGSILKGTTIQAKEMQGIVSEGMLVSLEELVHDPELVRDEYRDGIFLLDDIDLNLDPIKFFDLDDYIIDVSILSNRSDANSYKIMALELAAYFNSNYRLDELSKITSKSIDLKINTDQKSFNLVEYKGNLTIDLKDQLLLIKSNIKTMNNPVDLTNLNLIMTGVPTHVYDATQVDEINIYTKTEKINIFGNKEVNLDDALVVANSKDSISVAGVIGIENYKVSQDTSSLLFEFAIFDNSLVRKSMRQVKIDTMAGRQASKEISFGMMNLAYSNLITYFENKSSIKTNFNIYPSNYSIKFDEKILKNYLDNFESHDFSKSYNALRILGFEFKNNEVLVPSYRHDIEFSQDIVEEILRFYGYDNLVPVKPNLINTKIYDTLELKNSAVAAGFDEIRTYNLISEVKNKFNPFKFNLSQKLETFISLEKQVIRDSWIHSAIETIEYNHKRKLENLSFFEMGILNKSINFFGICSTNYNILQMKDKLEAILSNFEISYKEASFDFANPTEQLEIWSGDKFVGYIARISAKLTDVDLIVAEILIDELKPTNFVNADYINTALSDIDLNFELSNNETNFEIVEKLKPYDSKISWFVKDVFEKDNKNIVTVSITSDKETIDKLKNKFYN